MHPPPTELSRYLDNELLVAERDDVQRHVRECGPCRWLLQSLSQTIVGLGSLREPAPSGRAERIIAALWRVSREDGVRRLSVVRGDGAPGRVDWRARWRIALRYCLRRSQLRLTVPIGLLVGTALSLANQGGMLLSGEIDLKMCAVCALDYLLPFAAMNVVLVTASRLLRQR
jgi:hypothetical protein